MYQADVITDLYFVCSMLVHWSMFTNYLYLSLGFLLQNMTFCTHFNTDRQTETRREFIQTYKLTCITIPRTRADQL